MSLISYRTSLAISLTPPPLPNPKRKYNQIVFFHSLFLTAQVNLNYLCITQTDSLFEPDISGSGADNAVNYPNCSSWNSPFNPRTRNLSNNLCLVTFEPPYVPATLPLKSLSLYLSPLTFFLVITISSTHSYIKCEPFSTSQKIIINPIHS